MDKSAVCGRKGCMGVMCKNIIERIREKRRKQMLFWTFLLAAAAACLLFPGRESFAASRLAAPQGLLANGVREKIVLSWEPVRGADGYEVYEKQAGTKRWTLVQKTGGKKTLLTGRQAGSRFCYRVRAYKEKKNGTVRYGSFSKKTDTTLPKRAVTTLRNFLKTAIAPVGSTMYIWGGGWNKADTGAGRDALRIGLNPQWREFAGRQSASYDYRRYRYRRGYGLDCSGFVGWSVYNVLDTSKGSPGEGYVDKAASLAKEYAGNGWGSFRRASDVREYKSGDIMSGPGHVYIVLGECADGSVVFVHSSPAGVQIGGTASPAGRTDSRAVKLAEKYMKKQAPSWYRRFPDVARGSSYLRYSQFRWDVRGGSVMEDPDGYQERSAKAVLKDLFAAK